MVQISQIPVPVNSLVANTLPINHYSDCFYAQFTSVPGLSLVNCVRHLFYNLPKWVQWLMEFRNILVSPLGLKTGATEDKTIPIINVYKGGRVALFEVLECNGEEVLLYISDKHLDACLSIRLVSSLNLYEISMSTTVQFHNFGGRIYFFFIKPFHILIVRSMILRVAKHFSQIYKTNLL